MPLELEKEIMREIGLGRHFSHYAGNESCLYIRKEAVNNLSGVIQKHHDKGEEIDPPNEDLINTLRLVAKEGEDSEYTLKKTWQAASDVIRAHMTCFYEPEEKKSKVYKRSDDHIKKHFLS